MMLALSIKQPWASLIVGGPLCAGVKRTENRGRALATYARKLVGQRIAIHASKGRDLDAFEDIRHRCFGFGFDAKTECPYATMGEFPIGAVVGVATLERVFGPGEALTDDEARLQTNGGKRTVLLVSIGPAAIYAADPNAKLLLKTIGGFAYDLAANAERITHHAAVQYPEAP